MLRKEQNDLLTQTGPGTAMGDVYRCYWIPALLAEELPENDCPPVRVKLLSERMIAFRDSEGRYALIDEFCAHRGVSLWFGRNEHGSIRCPYHGWKYDFTGQCVEVPSEPVESGFCQKIKLTGYPLVKVGDVLWTYMGPAEHKPPLPDQKEQQEKVDPHLLLKEIIGNLKEASEHALNLMRRTVEMMSQRREQLEACPARHALELGIWSDKSRIPPEEVERLAPLWGQYFERR